MFHNKGHWAHKMDADMRPEVVSTLLSSVEAKWVQEAVNVLMNQTTQPIAFAAMETSCVKVSSAVVQGSEGDRLRVIEYMKTVCNEPNAKSNVEMCSEFANAIQEFMIGDNVYNREQLDMHDFCHKFWNTYVMSSGQVQEKKIQDEMAKQLAEEKKRQEEEIERRKQAAVEEAKKKLADAVAEKLQNNTSLNVAARWNAGAAANESTSEVTSTTTTTTAAMSINASAPIESTTTSTMSPPSLAHALTTHHDLENNATQLTKIFNATQVTKSFIMHNRTVLRNVQNATVQSNQTLSVETVENQTQVQKNTTSLIHQNLTVVQKDLTNATTAQGRLTARVIKQLRFVLNHTHQNLTNTTS